MPRETVGPRPRERSREPGETLRGGEPDPTPGADVEALGEGVDVSVVIPCRNEAPSVADCVREAREALKRWGYDGEVVVVDNASTDGSAAAARDAGARVVRQPIRGYGAACLRGLEEARGRILVLMDADGTYDPELLNRMVEPLRAGYDLVLGTRRNGEILPGSMSRAHRHFLEPIQTYLSRRFLPFRVSDVRCGMRAVRREALERLSLSSTGMEFASEMVVEAARAELAVVEVPVRFRPRVEEQSPRRNVFDGWRVVRQLLLMSPTRLFLLPGLMLLFLGMGLELALLPGPLVLGSLTLDFHFMFVGGALAILGLQLILLGLYAKTYGLVHDRAPADTWIRHFNLHYTLERGVALGGLFFGAGLAVNVWILSSWLMQGTGVLFAVRPAMLALTFMILGAEVVFASFFLSLLRDPEFGRV